MEKMSTVFDTKSTEIRKCLLSGKFLIDLLPNADMVINSTHLGWLPEDELLLNFLEKGQVFFDLNYSRCSKLISTALSRRATVINDTELLLRQGFQAFSFITGSLPPKGK
ncbi:MAG: hypothetical protein HQM08_00890 [Candidatus Riflebacteria bacterium]|nr:hypothetical protein [Candidatus Riflebacteria bacterium]